MAVGEEQWFTMVESDLGLCYVVPIEKVEDWFAWVDACVEGQTDCEAVPDWATGVTGRDVQFTNWKEG